MRASVETLDADHESLALATQGSVALSPGEVSYFPDRWISELFGEVARAARVFLIRLTSVQRGFRRRYILVVSARQAFVFSLEALYAHDKGTNDDEQC